MSLCQAGLSHSSSWMILSLAHSWSFPWSSKILFHLDFAFPFSLAKKLIKIIPAHFQLKNWNASSRFVLSWLGLVQFGKFPLKLIITNSKELDWCCRRTELNSCIFFEWDSQVRSGAFSSTVQQPTNGKIPKSWTEIVEGLSSSRVSKVHSPAFPRLCVHCKIDRTAFLVACLTQFTYGVYS